jgi:transcriptional regulator with XRE-family HTH domain
MLALDATKIVVSVTSQNYESRRPSLRGSIVPKSQDIRLAFQRRLKDVRQHRQLSQKELGILAGLDPFVASTRINRYEQGVHEPDLAMIARLASALNVPTAYLFADDERLARLILAFDQLASSEKDRLLKSIEKK